MNNQSSFIKKKGWVKRKCLICKIIFFVIPSLKQQKFCSLKCRHKAQSNCLKGNKFALGMKHKKETIEKYKKDRNTKEWRDKIFTPERNKKLSETRKLKYGSKNKDKRYQNRLIRNSAEYRNWRKSVFKRDNYTCQICKKRSGKGCSVYLEADHIKSFEYYPALRFDICNGRTLCRECHRKSHNFGVRVWQKLK